MTDALGLIEITGLSPAMVALDVMDKAAGIRLIQVELNDRLGALIKVAGDPAGVRAAVQAAEDVCARMRVECIADVINAPDDRIRPAVESPREFNALLEADVVYIPRPAAPAAREGNRTEAPPVNGQFALGLIETQGLPAVLEALDTAAKAADVQVVGREKLGGGYVTVIVKGDVAAVKAAIDAARSRVEETQLGKLIAAHVIARPSEAVLSILPKA